MAKMFADLGVALVDADQLAREIVEPGTEGLQAIVDSFGEQYIDANGFLDRKKLGQRVFEDPAALKTLNGITHPRIAAAGMARIAELQSTEVPYILYEAALLVENKIHTSFASLIVVAVSEDTQLDRLMKRDAAGREAAMARISSQLPIAEKIAVADYVIFNDDSREDTRTQVLAVHHNLQDQTTSETT